MTRASILALIIIIVTSPAIAAEDIPSNACSLNGSKWFPARNDGSCFASDERFDLSFRGRLQSPHCDQGYDLTFAGGNFVCVEGPQ